MFLFSTNIWEWINFNYPQITSKSISSSNPHIYSPYDCDHLYLPMSEIIITVLQENADRITKHTTSDTIIGWIETELDLILTKVNPKELVYIAIDSVSPLAIVQNIQKSSSILSNDDLVSPTSETVDFTYNQFLPGTSFTIQLSEKIHQWILKQQGKSLCFYEALKSDESYEKMSMQWILNDHMIQGLDYIKICNFIKTQRMNPDYDVNLKYVIYGRNDSSYRVGLVAHERQLSFLYKNVHPSINLKNFSDITNVNIYKTNRSLNTNSNYSYEITNMNAFRDCLFSEFSTKYMSNEPLTCDIDRVIDDIVLLSLLFSGEAIPYFDPHIHTNTNTNSNTNTNTNNTKTTLIQDLNLKPNMTIFQETTILNLKMLIDTYRVFISRSRKHLTFCGSIFLDNLGTFMKLITDTNNNIIDTETSTGNNTKVNTGTNNNAELLNNRTEKSSIITNSNLRYKIYPQFNSIIPARRLSKLKEIDNQTHDSVLSLQGYLISETLTQCAFWIKGLVWNYQYYYHIDFPSNTWYYPYIHSPTIKNIAEYLLEEHDIVFNSYDHIWRFENSNCLAPLNYLMIVLFTYEIALLKLLNELSYNRDDEEFKEYLTLGTKLYYITNDDETYEYRIVRNSWEMRNLPIVRKLYSNHNITLKLVEQRLHISSMYNNDTNDFTSSLIRGTQIVNCLVCRNYIQNLSPRVHLPVTSKLTVMVSLFINPLSNSNFEHLKPYSQITNNNKCKSKKKSTNDQLDSLDYVLSTRYLTLLKSIDDLNNNWCDNVYDEYYLPILLGDTDADIDVDIYIDTDSSGLQSALKNTNNNTDNSSNVTTSGKTSNDTTTTTTNITDRYPDNILFFDTDTDNDDLFFDTDIDDLDTFSPSQNPYCKNTKLTDTNNTTTTSMNDTTTTSMNDTITTSMNDTTITSMNDTTITSMNDTRSTNVSNKNNTDTTIKSRKSTIINTTEKNMSVKKPKEVVQVTSTGTTIMDECDKIYLLEKIKILEEEIHSLTEVKDRFVRIAEKRERIIDYEKFRRKEAELKYRKLRDSMQKHGSEENEAEIDDLVNAIKDLQLNCSKKKKTTSSTNNETSKSKNNKKPKKTEKESKKTSKKSKHDIDHDSMITGQNERKKGKNKKVAVANSFSELDCDDSDSDNEYEHLFLPQSSTGTSTNEQTTSTSSNINTQHDQQSAPKQKSKKNKKSEDKITSSVHLPKPVNPNNYHIKVKTVDGLVLTLEVNDEDTISDIDFQVSMREDFEYSDKTYLFKGKLLSYEATLKECKIKKNDLITSCI